MSTLPTLVFVHGGWHSHECYSRVITLLSSHGYASHTPEQPSIGSLASTKTLSDDILSIRHIVLDCVERGEHVIVVGHSNGGFGACGAVKGLSKVEREKGGKAGGVVCIALIAAFIPSADGGLFENLPALDISWWVVNEKNNTVMPKNPQHLFYNDLSSDDADYWTSQLRPMHYPPLGSGWGAAWKHIPLSYLICDEDNAQPVEVQEAMIQAVQKEGAKVTVERIMAGHSPFLSQPEKFVEWIRRSAGEVV